MNNQQISQLKRMLKKYGIKNAESIVRGAIEFNYNRFLELAEPIYGFLAFNHVTLTRERFPCWIRQIWNGSDW